MGIQDNVPVDTLFFGASCLPVTGLRVISTANRINLPSGDTDLYTVPAGKKALVVDATTTNPAASGATIQSKAQYKSGGVYTKYDFITGGAFTPGTYGNLALLVPMLLLAGESFAVNADNAGMSIWMFILEFDASVPINIARLSTTIASGDNTLFTAPSNGTELFPNLEAVSAGAPTKGSLFYFNNSGVNRTIGWNLVPSGGSVADANKIANNVSVTSPSVNVKNYYGGMAAGDVISLNTDANTAGQSAFVIYISRP